MLSRLDAAMAWLTARRIAAALPEKDARAFHITIIVQLSSFAITSAMHVISELSQPPERMGYISLVDARMLIELFIAWVLLRNGFHAFAQVMTCLSLVWHISLIGFGVPEISVHLYLPAIMLIPLLALPPRRRIARMLLAFLPWLVLIAHQVYFRILGGNTLFGPPVWKLTWDQLMPDLLFSQGLLLYLVYQFVRIAGRAEDRLNVEHEKSEKLLLNILPEQVAAELKEHGSSEPVFYESASVCFTDFQGFTKIAENITPRELIAELDKCFSYFDGLMERHNLEKLKTIGDSFMFAGGIPAPNRTHAVDCILAALEIQAFMNRMKADKEARGLPYWELRLGIHSGSLVAGVIGEKKFAYDVWSDTVNTASRCESSGVAGTINISGATYELARDFFNCEYRGKIAAKNKAEFEMYFVLGIKEALSEHGAGRVPNEQFRAMYAGLIE